MFNAAVELLLRSTFMQWNLQCSVVSGPGRLGKWCQGNCKNIADALLSCINRYKKKKNENQGKYGVCQLLVSKRDSH